MLTRVSAQGRRAFSAQVAQASFIDKLMGDYVTQNPLTEEFPGLPELAGKAHTSAIKVTTLPNGLKVASQDAGGATASIAVHIKAGSRYETVAGTASVLEAVAFKSTSSRSTAKVQREVEDIGASVAAKAGRETFVLSGEVLRDGLHELGSVLGEALVAPKLSYWEVNEEKAVLAAALASAASDPLPTLVEALHAAAFGGAAPLGRSQFASPSGLDAVDADALRAFLGARATGGNAVLSGVNVSHDELLELAHTHFAGLAEGTGATGAAAAGAPVVIGGESRIRGEGGVAHVGIALAAPGASAGPKALAAVGVLQALLGGTGGRAGSRHSRLAKLGGSGASATAFAFPYSDAGLLGVVGSASESGVPALVSALTGALKDAAGVAAAAGELARAKAAYKLSLVAAAESRAGARDEAAASLLWGSGSPLAAQLAAVDAVTAADVSNVAKAALASPPAIAAIGSLGGVPRYDQLVAQLK